MKRLLWVVCLGLLAGCGGGGGGEGRAAIPGINVVGEPNVDGQVVDTSRITTPVRFDIAWDARSRAIQALPSALSAYVILKKASIDGSDFRILVNRDTISANPQIDYITAASIYTGTYDLEVTFYARFGGSGDVVGTGVGEATIAPDGTGIDTLAMHWRVASVEIPPNQSVSVGESKSLKFTARASDGALIALTPGSEFWAVHTGTGYLRFTKGMAGGLLPGSAEVTLTVDSVTTTGVISVTSSNGTRTTQP